MEALHGERKGGYIYLVSSVYFDEFLLGFWLIILIRMPAIVK